MAFARVAMQQQQTQDTWKKVAYHSCSVIRRSVFARKIVFGRQVSAKIGVRLKANIFVQQNLKIKIWGEPL